MFFDKVPINLIFDAMTYRMLKQLKIKNIRKKCNALYGKHTPQALENPATIAVIIDEQIFQNNKHTKALIETLKREASRVELMVFNALEPKIDDPIFTEDQLNWRGEFKTGTAAEKFSRQQVDLLINYVIEPELPLELLSLTTRASLKIGLAGHNNTLNDLDIDINPIEIHKFVEELKTYLLKIK